MTTVYLITVTVGEYSDARFWAVTYRLMKTEAEELAARMRAEVVAVDDWYNDWTRMHPLVDRFDDEDRSIIEKALADVTAGFCFRPSIFDLTKKHVFSVDECSDEHIEVRREP